MNIDDAHLLLAFSRQAGEEKHRRQRQARRAAIHHYWFASVDTEFSMLSARPQVEDALRESLDAVRRSLISSVSAPIRMPTRCLASFVSRSWLPTMAIDRVCPCTSIPTPWSFTIPTIRLFSIWLRLP